MSLLHNNIVIELSPNERKQTRATPTIKYNFSQKELITAKDLKK